MPIANFPNWDACVAHQVGKGYSREVARKICGKIEANTRAEAKRERNGTSKRK